MSTKQKFDQGFLESHGLSPVVASLIIVEFDALRDERDTAIAAAKDKHSVRAGINSDLKSELERVQKQAAAIRKALVRLCNSWAEGTERENYEAMKEAKAALEHAPHGETENT